MNHTCRSIEVSPPFVTLEVPSPSLGLQSLTKSEDSEQYCPRQEPSDLILNQEEGLTITEAYSVVRSCPSTYEAVASDGVRDEPGYESYDNSLWYRSFLAIFSITVPVLPVLFIAISDGRRWAAYYYSLVPNRDPVLWLPVFGFLCSLGYILNALLLETIGTWITRRFGARTGSWVLAILRTVNCLALCSTMTMFVVDFYDFINGTDYHVIMLVVYGGFYGVCSILYWAKAGAFPCIRRA